MHPSRNRDGLAEQNDEENDFDGINGPSGSMTNMLLEMDPSNLNQNDINTKKK